MNPQLFHLLWAANIPVLRDLAIGVANTLSESEVAILNTQIPGDYLAFRAIALLRNSNGWRKSEALMDSLVLPLASYFNLSITELLHEAILANSQIWNASGIFSRLQKVWDANRTQTDVAMKALWKSFAISLWEKNKRGMDKEIFISSFAQGLINADVLANSDLSDSDYVDPLM